MIDYSERYRDAVTHLSASLDSLIENIDPDIYHSGIGRNLIALIIIKKAVAILVEDMDADAAYAIIYSILQNCALKK